MFKRNQVEDAIARVLQRGSTRLNSEMRSRVKRLLEIDRARGRNKRSNDPEQANFAFHGADTPGRNENLFSDYETFALSTGLRLMGLGWPQGVVVALLRCVRPELEQHHRRILRQAPAGLPDEHQARAQAKPGDIAVGGADSLFLVIIAAEERRGLRSVALSRGQREVCELFHRYGPGFAFTLLELVNSVHALSAALAQTKPRLRGRARAR